MRVLIFAADTHRCGYRLIWPGRALAAAGHDVEVLTREDRPPSTEPARWQGWEDLDVAVFQRPLQRRWLGSIERFQACGVTVVVDIDDDFQALPPGNAVWDGVHPATSPDCNPHHLAEACRRADWVTVTTEALAQRYGRPGRVSIVPNHVPAAYLDVPDRVAHEGLWIGWTGAVSSHPGDLDVTRGAVARAATAAGAELHVVGPGDGVAKALGADEVTATGYVPLAHYPYEMAQLDVGIVPLKASAFNEAKSYLKGLEFAALGVPFVASPTGPYRQLTEWAGILARKPREWYMAVRMLAESANARADLAGSGRAWAATQTVEGNVGQWWDAWTTARERSTRKVPA